MQTPTLPHLPRPSVSLPSVSLPSVALPHVPVPHVTDALASGIDKVQDLASSAVDVIDDIPDKAAALAGALIPALRPKPRRSAKPFALLAVALASVVLVAWFVRKRRAEVEPYLAASQGAPEPSVSEAS
jgi:hypothetical protein